MIEAGTGAATPEESAFLHELLQFERLMSELSTSFINLPAAEIDAVIGSGLRRIVETLDIDRSSLTLLTSDTGQLRTTHSWAVEGLPPVLGRVWAKEDFPWLIAMGRAGKPLAFSNPRDLPPEAAAEKRAYQSIGQRSHVAQPLIVAGELIGFLGFGSLRRERAWPADLVARMRLLADIFASALARKNAREQFEESEARLDAIARSAMDAFITVDGNQRIVLVNAAAEKLFGCDASQVIGAPLDRFIPERFRTAHRAHVEGFDRTGEMLREMRTGAPLWALRADGTEFPIEASISRRRQSRASGCLPSFCATPRSGRTPPGRSIRRWGSSGCSRISSASMLRAPSIDVARVIPKALQAIGEFLRVDRVSLWRLVAPQDKDVSLIHAWYAAGVPALPAILRNTDSPWLGDRLLRGEVVRLTNPGGAPDDAIADPGRPPWFGTRSLLSVPLLVDGNVAAVLSLATLRAERSWPDVLVPRVRLIGEALANVLERDRRARQLAEAQGEAAQFRERLAHLVRVHTVGEMSAALAHEITQPLGAIENYALAARRRAADASPDLAKIVELLDKVIGQATRAGDVMMRLRGLVKRHDLELKELDVERAATTCIDMVKSDCELREIRIELKTTGTLPRVVADEIHVQQVILNLLRNAMEAMSVPQPGVPKTITVETALRGADTVTVQVADRGPGIPAGDLERVFESFYSTKSGGLGIGLAICRKLIEAHGGALWASHNPGGGVVFQFTLPVRGVGA